MSTISNKLITLVSAILLICEIAVICVLYGDNKVEAIGNEEIVYEWRKPDAFMFNGVICYDFRNNTWTKDAGWGWYNIINYMDYERFVNDYIENTLHEEPCKKFFSEEKYVEVLEEVSTGVEYYPHYSWRYVHYDTDLLKEIIKNFYDKD